MKTSSIKFCRHQCFKSQWSGFEDIKPITVIIGPNNSGKSRLLELVEHLTAGELAHPEWKLRCKGVLDRQILEPHFNAKTRDGVLRGNHWNDHGAKLETQCVEWTLANGGVSDVHFPDGFDPASPYGEDSTNARMTTLARALLNAKPPFPKDSYRHLAADRNILPETPQNNLSLNADGSGATNIIRKFIVSSEELLPREIVQEDILGALNQIFARDGQFTEVNVQHHEDSNGGPGEWEVYLAEEQKGLISLSNSGSGLRTIILALLNLIAVPHFEGKQVSEYIFAFEELENNLHPGVLRRLYEYLEDFAITHRISMFITTHSSVALDFFGLSNNAQIVSVTHDGAEASTKTVEARFDKTDIIYTLGAKPSDLLQANGIIWVEGPSDRIYLNHWIQLASDNQLKLGRDYEIAFYGGSLLARISFAPEEDERSAHAASLFNINENVIVVCDGDRSSPTARIKGRVKRIKKEIEALPNGHIWILRGKTIENYIPSTVLGNVFGSAPRSDPDAYVSMCPPAEPASYLEEHYGRRHIDKVDLACDATKHMTAENMGHILDWEKEITLIVQKIRVWNS